MRDIFIACDCRSDEHVLHFTYDDDPEFKCLYASVYLSQYLSFWKRTWAALKYTFNFRRSEGDFDCVLIPVRDAKNLRDLLDEYIGGKNEKTDL
jgi:hypothetical protein